MQTLLLTRCALTLDTTGETSDIAFTAKTARNFVQLILTKIIIIVATRCQILRLKCTKFDFGWGSAPDLLDGGEGAGYSLPKIPTPALSSSGLAASVRAWKFFTNISQSMIHRRNFSVCCYW